MRITKVVAVVLVLFALVWPAMGSAQAQASDERQSERITPTDQETAPPQAEVKPESGESTIRPADEDRDVEAETSDASTPAAAQLVSDGGFEGGTPNASWDESSTNFGTPLCTLAACGPGGGSGPHSGDWWVWFGGFSGVYEAGAVTQNVFFPEGSGVISFWLEIPVAETTGSLWLVINGTTFFSVTAADAASYPTYTQVQIPYTNSVSTVYEFEFLSETPAGSGPTNFMVDDVSVVPDSPASLDPPADFDGDGDTDIAVYRPSNGTWYVKDQATTQWGFPTDIPVPGDYDGDGDTDVAVYRPSNGTWYIKDQATIKWGVPTDITVPGDYDGDGDTDIAVYRPSNGTWYIKDQGTTKWGVSTDVPVPGDYDADGDTDIAVYRPSNGTWYVKDQVTTKWGVSTDVPVPGDYDHDGDSDLAVYRPSNGTWYVKDQTTTKWGISTDVPVPGDYDHDGDTDIAVYRPSNGTWYVKDQTTTKWGLSTDIPLPLPSAIREAYY